MGVSLDCLYLDGNQKKSGGCDERRRRSRPDRLVVIEEKGGYVGDTASSRQFCPQEVDVEMFGPTLATQYGDGNANQINLSL